MSQMYSCSSGFFYGLMWTGANLTDMQSFVPEGTVLIANGDGSLTVQAGSDWFAEEGDMVMVRAGQVNVTPELVSVAAAEILSQFTAV